MSRFFILIPLICFSFSAYAFENLFDKAIQKFQQITHANQDCNQQTECSAVAAHCEGMQSANVFVAQQSGDRVIPDFYAMNLVRNTLYKCEAEDEVGFFKKPLGKQFSDLEEKRMSVDRDIQPEFEKIKTSMLKYLEDKKLRTKNSNFDAIIQRVKKVQLVELSPEDCEFQDDPAYDAESFEITFCPGFKNWSNGQLYFALAHELSHSVDPCHVGYDLIKGKNREMLVMNPAKKQGKILIPALSPHNNPFLDTIQCLSRSESIGSYVQSKSSENDNFRYCNSIHDSGSKRQIQIGEHFSDWLGSEIIADLTTTNQIEWDPSELNGLVHQDCDGYVEKIRSEIKKSVSSDCAKKFDEVEKEISTNLEKELLKGPHGPAQKRLDRIFYAQPVLAKKAGCVPAQGLKYCQ